MIIESSTSRLGRIRDVLLEINENSFLYYLFLVLPLFIVDYLSGGVLRKAGLSFEPIIAFLILSALVKYGPYLRSAKTKRFLSKMARVLYERISFLPQKSLEIVRRYFVFLLSLVALFFATKLSSFVSVRLFLLQSISSTILATVILLVASYAIFSAFVYGDHDDTWEDE